ncbi:MAG TPA: FecR family protein [Terriglobales bacterium]|nr:FecR family protein [Terriglobales bacterium]
MKRTSPGIVMKALALFLCYLLSPLHVFAQAGGSAQPAGQITSLIPIASRNNTPAKFKDDVHWNDLIQTEKSGRARIGLTDGSILSVGSNSQLKITQHDASVQQTQVELDYGKLRSRVVAITKPDGKYEVRTPNAVAGVIGTDFSIFFNPETKVSTVVVYSGTVVVSGLGAAAGQQATLQAGQMLEVSSHGVGSPQTTPPVVQQASISDTTTENTSAAGSGGSHLLRNLLIGLGVAVASVAIGVTVGGKDAAPAAPAASSSTSNNPNK